MLIHVVKAGESLWEIADEYRVEIENIIDINKLQGPDKLAIGQSLIIPTEDTLHIVAKGETLWEIAEKYEATVMGIAELSRIMNPNEIYPGLKLYIPAIRYTIRPGESLEKIARRYGVSLERLMKVNNIQRGIRVYPGTVLIIPKKKGPSIEVNGYTYELKERAVDIVKKDGNYLTYLSPFPYLIKKDGGLETIEDIPAIEAAYLEEIVPMMSITNFTITDRGENLARIILDSPYIQGQLLTNIVNTMKEKGYRGLNIDFENVLPEDRELYNKFLQLAVDVLHEEGYFLSTALAPKMRGKEAGLFYGAHDYKAHGKIADFVVLMTYEWGHRMGPPQAISPLNEIKSVIDYAISVIPKEKILFGLQIYARDWMLPHRRGQEAETFSCQEAVLRAVENGAEIQYDEVSQSPFYRYRDKRGRMHEVWFEDARSVQAKFDLVKSYDLKGISYWALGYPFPQNWALLEDNFTVKKLI